MTPDEIDATLFRTRVPAIAMLRTPRQAGPGTPGCWFGGEPTLPPEIPWPVYAPNDREWPTIQRERTGIEVPMHFLAQINLAHCPRVLGLPLLPREGTLFVFYDPLVAPETNGIAFATGTGCRVIYVPGDVQDCPARRAPEMPDLTGVLVSESHRGPSPSRRWPFDFLVFDTYPAAGDALPKQFNPRLGELLDERWRLLDAHLGPKLCQKRRYEIGGFHWIFGTTQRQRFPTARYIKGGGHNVPALGDDDLLLFRFTTDDDLSLELFAGEAGAGFWIKRQDLAAQRFDNVVIWADN